MAWTWKKLFPYYSTQLVDQEMGDLLKLPRSRTRKLKKQAMSGSTAPFVTAPFVAAPLVDCLINYLWYTMNGAWQQMVRRACPCLLVFWIFLDIFLEKSHPQFRYEKTKCFFLFLFLPCWNRILRQYTNGAAMNGAATKSAILVLVYWFYEFSWNFTWRKF